MPKHVPDGWHTVTPRLFVERPDDLVEFIKTTFDATLRPRADHRAPAEVVIGDSIVMIGKAGQRKATPGFLYVYVPDTDATYRRALDAGASSIEPPLDTPYGDRRATVEDAFGNVWQIATRIVSAAP